MSQYYVLLFSFGRHLPFVRPLERALARAEEVFIAARTCTSTLHGLEPSLFEDSFVQMELVLFLCDYKSLSPSVTRRYAQDSYT